jgi:hypothetical protein
MAAIQTIMRRVEVRLTVMVCRRELWRFTSCASFSQFCDGGRGVGAGRDDDGRCWWRWTYANTQMAGQSTQLDYRGDDGSSDHCPRWPAVCNGPGARVQSCFGVEDEFVARGDPFVRGPGLGAEDADGEEEGYDAEADADGPCATRLAWAGVVVANWGFEFEAAFIGPGTNELLGVGVVDGVRALGSAVGAERFVGH